MENHVFRWCFIGTGQLAVQVAKEILASGRHQIVAVYTRRFAKAVAFSERFGGKAYERVEDALEDPQVDGVYVVTPHSSHYHYAKLALEHHRPVLVEKPFTLNVEDARKLIELSKKEKTYIAEAMWTWFFDSSRQVKTWIDQSRVGKIQKVSLSYCYRFKHNSARLLDLSVGGGALYDIGIYPVTYVYRLFGFPQKISCKGKLENGVDIVDEITLSYPDFDARIRVSMNDWKGLEKLVIQGDEGIIRSSFYHSGKKVSLHRKKEKKILIDGRGGYLYEFDCVKREIEEGKLESEYVPLFDTLQVMRILEECLCQMEISYPKGEE